MADAQKNVPTAEVVAVQDDLVSIETTSPDATLIKNEVVYIVPRASQRTGGREEHLKAEVLRVRGKTAEAQVYESTVGVGVGDSVLQSGQMLSAALGPGLLGQIYDGLQVPLEDLAKEFGFFLPRGAPTDPLDKSKKWAFTPTVRTGQCCTMVSDRSLPDASRMRAIASSTVIVPPWIQVTSTVPASSNGTMIL